MYKNIKKKLNNALDKIFPFLPTNDDLKYLNVKKAMGHYIKLKSCDYDINEKIQLLKESNLKLEFHVRG